MSSLRMAKPSARDIDAGGDLMSILQLIDGNNSWKIEGPDSLDELEDDFDPDEPGHLAALYNSLMTLLEHAPGFPGRVLGGMCYVICYEKNQFLDPGKDYLALHPDVIEGLQLLNKHRADFIPRLVREARAAVAEVIEASAARHLSEMGLSS
jgi:hypothetical protein